MWHAKWYPDYSRESHRKDSSRAVKHCPSYISWDLFGPFGIKGEMNKLGSTKGHEDISNCFLSQAIDILIDCSTDSFILIPQRLFQWYDVW